MPIFRSKIIYFLFNAGLACLVPFMSLYYRERGMTGIQIGMLSGIIPLTTWLSAPLWGGLADARARHRAILLLTNIGLWLAVAALAFATTFPALLIAVVVYAIFIGPIMPMFDNVVIALLGEEKANYGNVRVWGAIGWGTAALLIGPALERAGLHWAFYGFLFFMTLNFIVLVKLPMKTVVRASHTYLAGLSILLRNGRFLLLLLVALVYGLTHGILYSYQFLYLEEMGASRTLMALSLTVATVSEAPFWFISAWMLRRFGTNWMIVLALLTTILRNLGLSAIGVPWLVLPLSLLHGPSFAVLSAAGVADADAAAPPGLGATAQGLFSGTTFGLGSALGGFVGGPAYVAFGFARLFSALGWLTFATLLVFIALRLVLRNPRYAS